MKIFKTKILLIPVILSLIFLISSCKKEPSKPDSYEIKPIEPEMILIDENLTFKYMESVQKPIIDTSFVMTLEPYYIGKYEVMNQEFLQFILDDGYNRQKVTLNRPFLGLHIPPMIWCEMNNFSSGSVCLVLASEYYDEEDYIRDYKLFKKMVEKV